MAVDRIREMQRQAAEAEEARRQAAADATRLREIETREREDRERQRAEERRQLVRSVTSRVLQESGVLVELGDIESRLLQGVEKHRIIVDLDNANTKLVWGSRLNISPQGVISRRPLMLGLAIDPILDYSHIDVSVNVDSESLGINGRTFLATEWRNRPKIIAEALAEAYLNPRRSVEDNRPVQSSGGSNSECCCS